MKNAILLLAAFSLSSAASATSPLLGSWSVDTTKLPMPPEARPKSVTMTFSEAGAGKWRTNVDIRGGEGSVRQMTSTYALDGSAAPDQGAAVAGSLSLLHRPRRGTNR